MPRKKASETTEQSTPAPTRRVAKKTSKAEPATSASEVVKEKAPAKAKTAAKSAAQKAKPEQSAPPVAAPAASAPAPAAASAPDNLVPLVGRTAGTVWHHLRQNGATRLSELAKAVAEPEDLVNQAVGWLAREDKLSMRKEGRSTVVELS